MVLPSSGNITFAMINTELGRSANAPLNLNETAVRALAGKPSGGINLADFHGKSAVVAPNGILYADSFAAYTPDAGASCSWELNIDGNVYRYINGYQEFQYTWRVAGSNNQFDLYVDHQSGAPVSGGMGWFNVTQTRTFSMYNANQNSSQSAQIRAVLRRTSDQAWFSDVRIDMNVTNGALV